jgi:hypothetical protein
MAGNASILVLGLQRRGHAKVLREHRVLDELEAFHAASPDERLKRRRMFSDV